MSTSLAEQLRKLAVPQTAPFHKDKKRASLLFDPKEAANFDRETFHELGVRGLKHLIKLAPGFAEFEKTLFDVAAKDLQRAVQTKETNEKLDREIRKFFFYLSPFFLLKSAHQTLEWLINRFQIHQYNIDDLMTLILPYHETIIFVRVLQLIDVKAPGNKWNWLYSSQKEGIGLSKLALLNHCSQSTSFLKFVCSMPLQAVKMCGSHSANLNTLFTFCYTTVMGALENSAKVTDVQVGHILKLLLKSFSSEFVEVCASGIMITAQLARRSKLAENVLMALVNKAVRIGHELQTERTILLILLYQYQPEALTSIPQKALYKLATCRTFVKNLAEAAESEADIAPMLIVLMKESLRRILSQEENYGELQEFCENLVSTVKLEDDDAELLIQTVVNSYIMKETPDESDDSDMEMDTGEEISHWFSSCLVKLERQYASPFDSAMKKILENTHDEELRKNLLVIMGFKPRISCLLTGVNVFEKLNHPMEAMRIEGVRYLLTNYKKFQVDDKEFLVEAMRSRLQEDSVSVLNEVLECPSPLLASIVGEDFFVEELIKVATRFWYQHDVDIELKKKVIRCLCSEVSVETKEVAVMFTVLLYLLPRTNEDLPIAVEVLKSEFGCKNKLMKTVGKDIPSLENLHDHELVSCVVFQKMAKSRNIPNVEMLGSAMDSLSIFNTEPVYKFIGSILMTCAVSNIAKAEIKWKVVDKILKYFEYSNASLLYLKTHLPLSSKGVLSSCMEAASKRILPVQGLLFCLNSLSKYLVLPKDATEQKWWHIATMEKDFEITAPLLFIRFYGAVLEGCNLETKSVREEFKKLSNKIMERCFPDVNAVLGFLSNLWVAHELGEVHEKVVGEAFQLRAVKRAAKILESRHKAGECLSWTARVQCEPMVVPLLIALASPSQSVRAATLECLSLIKKYCDGTDRYKESFCFLIEKLLDRQEEIKLDPRQISVCMYTTLSPDPAVQSLVRTAEQRQALSEYTDFLFSCILKKTTPIHMRAALLKILTHVNAKHLMENLSYVGKEILECAANHGNKLDYYQSVVYTNIIARFEGSVVECLDEYPGVWEFFESSLKDYTTVLQDNDGKDTCPAIVSMNQITKEFFETIPNLQQSVFSDLIAVGTATDSPEVISAVGRVVKRIALDSSLVAEELKKTLAIKPPSDNSGATPGASLTILKTQAWRRGVTLLELIQNKKKLHSIHLIVPVLFDVLKSCLDFVEQAPVEYIKQLLLSCLLHCCTKISSEETAVSEGVLERIFNVELVVRCIRASQNPQTHHHALLVLSHLATLLPDQVLHNIMAIFTFMGSSILRQDDSYSFQIISEVVDAVIPVLVKAQGSGVKIHKLYNPVAGVVRVFVDALMDIPGHRQQPLFHKLLTTLGPEHFLWLLMALILESQACHKPGSEKDEEGFLPKRLTVAVNIALQFSPSTVLTNCILLMDYLLTLVSGKEQKEKLQMKKKRNAGVAAVTTLFNVAQNSKTQYHHFKYAIVLYLSHVLGHSEFINQVASLPHEEAKELEPIYAQLIENILQHIQIAAHANETHVGRPTAKYWKCMLNQSYDLLDRVNALLLSDMFLRVILRLLDNPIPTLRRKAMELMNARLQNQEFFSSCKLSDLFLLIDPLLNIIKTMSDENVSLDVQLNQQTALVSIKLLARLMAAKETAVFAKVFDELTSLVKTRIPSGNVLASTLLCGAELCSCLHAYAIKNLPNFMPFLLKVLKKEKKTQSPDVVLLAIVTSVFKIVERLPNFLSPYLKKILLEISILSTRFQVESEVQKVAPIVQKLKYIKQTLSSEIPLRILVPVVNECYTSLLRKKEFKAVDTLMDVLVGSFSNMTNADFKNLRTELTNFFMTALQFRSDNADSDQPEEVIASVEGNVIRALVALVVKLSESSFRPLYYNMYHWATSLDVHKERLITFYRVSYNIAECLKGLFILFAGHFIKNAATLLDETNLTKTQTLLYGTGETAERKSLLLLESVVKTLHSTFLYDSANFLTKERFEALMQPLVDQMENTLGGLDSLKERSNSFLTSCIVQFGYVAADDSLWKQLNYQILLKMRHSLPAVRLIAVDTVCGLATKLGDDFLPQLPETVPFLAELLEDEEQEVEQACVKVVQNLEEILGEPLKKYF